MITLFKESPVTYGGATFLVGICLLAGLLLLGSRLLGGDGTAQPDSESGTDQPVDPTVLAVQDCRNTSATISSYLVNNDTQGAVGVAGTQRPEWQIGVAATRLFMQVRAQQGNEVAFSETREYVRTQCENAEANGLLGP